MSSVAELSFEEELADLPVYPEGWHPVFGWGPYRAPTFDEEAIARLSINNDEEDEKPYDDRFCGCCGDEVQKLAALKNN